MQKIDIDVEQQIRIRAQPYRNVAASYINVQI